MAVDGTDDVKRLVAYVVPNSGYDANATKIRRCLESVLPNFMIPDSFIVLDSLPINSSGKIDWRALPAPQFRAVSQKTIVSPRSPIEHQVANIWADVLKVNEVSVDQNFFELGGHSLLAMQIVSRIQKTFKVRFSLRSLFEAPTVAKMSNIIEVLQGHVVEISSELFVI